MYSCKFISDNGTIFLLGTANNIVFDIDGLSGISVDLGTSQGFAQVGETVETKSIGGKTLTVKGVIYKNLATTKKSLKNAFSAFASGRLIFENNTYIYVNVKETPTISPLKNNGVFTFRLFAPFPFFKELAESTFYIGAIKPMFSFPVNYETPHIFGEKSDARYINVINNGDLKTAFRVDLTTAGTSDNITLTNMQTFEFLKLNGTLNVNERIIIYRDERNQLKAELYSNGKTTDILSWIDEESNLFELNIGDNLILATDDDGGENLTAQITFNAVMGAVYEY